jgi:hypothetical protein
MFDSGRFKSLQLKPDHERFFPTFTTPWLIGKLSRQLVETECVEHLSIAGIATEQFMQFAAGIVIFPREFISPMIAMLRIEGELPRSLRA